MPNSFSQFSIGRQAVNPSIALNGITPLAFEPLSPERIVDFRLQLISHLQTSLDIEQIITIFYRHLKQTLPIGGIHYQNTDKMMDIHCGQLNKHRCNYQLAVQKESFGEISFTRNKRFSEKEMSFIESIMDIAIFPIRNALKYHDALATAMIDPLTGLNNRGAMAISLNRDIERARRHEDQNMSIIMVDVDHFKNINDRYGHLSGDDVLRQVAHIIQNSIRGSDACFRYGGEEFLISLSNSNLGLARRVAERIRMAIADQVRLSDRNKMVTASFGIAHYNNEPDWPDLVNRADKALYSAKQNGRNRVVASLEQEKRNPSAQK